MAKGTDLTKEMVLGWFEALSFNEMDEVLIEMQGTFDRVKMGEIRELEAKLARLRGAPVTRGPKKGGIVPPKYRNPKDVQKTWSGRGVQPAWVREHVEDGGTLEDLLIDKG